MRSPSSRFGIAVVGLNPRGWHLLEQLGLRDDVLVTGAWDLDDALRLKASEQGWTSPDRLDTLLEQSATKGVAIAVPLSQRADLVRRCLSLGRHVLTEPPVAVSADAARELYDVAAARGCCLWAASPRRWDDDLLAAAAAVRSSRLGSLHAIRFSSAEWAPWARVANSGPPDEPRSTLDVLAPHIVDQLAQLTTANVSNLWVQPLRAEDGFLAVLTLANGVIVQLDVRRRSLAGLQAGWMLEGLRAGYRSRRTYTPTPDGEIVDEPVRCEPMPADALLREWLQRCQSGASDTAERQRGEWVAGVCEQLLQASADVS